MKQDTREELSQRMEAAAESADAPQETVDAVLDVLFESREDFYWIGAFLQEGEAVARKAMHGPLPPVHSYRVGPGSHVGLAVYEEKVKLVPDVTEDPEYSASFVATKSKCVVPVRWEGEVVGAIDCQSKEKGAFSETDRELLERAAQIIAPHLVQLEESEDSGEDE